MPPARKPIRPLSPTVASQIAAGEVIERPASVVKELAENALDAGATRIAIDLEAGGVELIRVSDDGTGIPEAELPLALTAHATSKIASPDDLDHIATMGFRGEALASIASVARVSIRSRTAEADGASLIEAEAGVAHAVRPASGPVGTTLEVRNLFFATPARRKFLKTPQTERGRCLTAVKDLAMANPAVGFTLTSDGKTVLDLEPNQTPRDRVLDILGRELEPQLLEAHADDFDDAR
ncbi:MAG: DNA mismatch repair endonuclease MutL, partial [Planctomycetota bacterium]